MKKSAILVIIIGAVILLAGIRGLSGEDDWICGDNGWVKHGNPSAPMPMEACGDFLIVNVYFNNSNLDPEASCNKVFAVERKVPETQAIARAAVEELLKGPTEKEKSEGFFSSINSGVKIQKLSIENGIAKIDFDGQIEFQVGGSCRVSAISHEITETLKQFPSIKEVIISVDGRTEDILQP